MSKNILFIPFVLSFFAAGALAADCTPRLNGAGETLEIMAGSEATGSDARIEIAAARKVERTTRSTVDLFGRELSIITQVAKASSISVTSGSETASAQLVRYCSQSTSKSAKCVDACFRWSNYERD